MLTVLAPCMCMLEGVAHPPIDMSDMAHKSFKKFGAHMGMNYFHMEQRELSCLPELEFGQQFIYE